MNSQRFILSLTASSAGFTVLKGGFLPSEIPGEGSGTDSEQNGIGAMEGENTRYPLGLWVKKTPITGHTGSGYLEFTGNNSTSGPAMSSLVCNFKINTGGRYNLDLPCAKESIDDRTNLANDCYVRVGGNHGSGPDAGQNQPNDATLSVLKSDTKYFGGATLQLDWSLKLPKNRLDPSGTENKRNPYFNFKTGKEYTLVVSGCSQFFKIDRIVFWHTTASSCGAAENTNLPESTLLLIPDHSHAAISSLPMLDSDTIPYSGNAAGNALAINASVMAYRGKFARASRTFDGIYRLRGTTITEEDGKSTNRRLVNGMVKATFQNPHFDAGSPLDLTENDDTWSCIVLQPADTIAIESNTQSNGGIPENGGPAPARGRRCNLEIIDAATSLTNRPSPGCPAIVTDANVVDPDDVCARPVSLAMIRAAGIEQHLVHDSDASEPTNKPQFTAVGASGIAEEKARETMNQSRCDGTASHGDGFGDLTFWNRRSQKPQLVAELKVAINATTLGDPLWITAAGEPDVANDAVLPANSGAMQHVHVITHQPYNDVGIYHHLDDAIGIQSFGAHVARITDQKINLKTSVSDWYWARDYADPRLRWIWDRGSSLLSAPLWARSSYSPLSPECSTGRMRG